VDTPRPSPRTNRTRRVPHPVLIGHAASLSQAREEALRGDVATLQEQVAALEAAAAGEDARLEAVWAARAAELERGWAARARAEADAGDAAAVAAAEARVAAAAEEELSVRTPPPLSLLLPLPVSLLYTHSPPP
jgi:hypothetical protein